jgi:HK97 family phage major capsid protein
MSIAESYKSVRPLVQYARCLLLAHQHGIEPVRVAERLYPSRRDEQLVQVMRAAVDTHATQAGAPGTELYSLRTMQTSFADAVRPLTVLGKLQTTRVPLATTLPMLATRTVFSFVEERMPIPVAAPAFGSTNVVLAPKKVAGILVTSKELMAHSEGEAVLQREMVAGCIEGIDRGLLDPLATVSAGRPASITSESDITYQGAGADTAAEIDVLLSAMVGDLIGKGSTLERCAWVTSPQNCAALSMMRGATTDALSYPGLTVNGGTLFGLPLYASASAPSDGLTLVDGGELLVGDEGETAVQVTDSAMVQMDDAPSGTTNLVSLFQADSLGLKIVRTINWQFKRAPAPVAYCTNFQLAAGTATTTG